MAVNNYNAETAWDYLGTGLFGRRGAYDYSSLPEKQNIYFNILGSTRGPQARRPSGNYAIKNPLGLIDTTFNIDRFFAYPENVVTNAMAGKFLNLF